MLAGVAITYDQALAAFTFLAHGDTERARRVIAFFERADRSENLYNTAYDSETGTTWEYNLSVGPNAWIALAMLRVANATKSRPMQSMAAVIGDTLARMQDAEGGIKGGPSVEWYSVEHQLDVYALFGALHKATGAQVYAKARERTFEWIKHYGFDASQTHIRRGKNDNTLACDVYTWSVAALGPQKLGEAGMDARAVMQKAEDLCYVTDSAVKGFDFTDAGKIGRRPVVSSEWTAQAALSWSILGDGERAARYLEGILPMASGGALPYASAAGADTGHGWKTPQGEATGSVAGTAYYLLARRGVNPLDPDARLPRAENVGK